MVATSSTSETPRNLKKRYSDAYLVSKVTVSFGNLIKIVGVLVAGVIIVGALFMASQGAGVFVVGGIVVAGLSGLLFYLLGVLVAANGQVLQATLDSAVNSSPFLTDADRAEIMSLTMQGLEARGAAIAAAQNRFVTFDCPQCGTTIHQRVAKCMFCDTSLTDEAIDTAVAAYKARQSSR